MPSRTSALLAASIWLLCCGLIAEPIYAQVTWEYSPYQIRVWVAFQPSGELNGGVLDTIRQTILEQAEVVAGAAWKVQVEACPDSLLRDATTAIDTVTSEQVGQVDPDLLAGGDKLFLVAVHALPTEHLIRVRELDCHTRWWFPAVQRRVTQPHLVAQACFDLLAGSFHAITRVEGSEMKEAEVRVRAGGLIVREACPAQVSDDAVLLPIIRRNDRQGQPLDKGIQVAPWTLLTVKTRNRSLLTCQIHTGMRVALGGRSSARTQKFALVMHPLGDHTLLKLETRGTEPHPISGYEIYAKDPFTEETELLGKTDWRGAVRIERTGQRVVLIYVRNGGRLLARLPIAPGLDSQVTAQVADDDQRLAVEGFVKGIQSRVMDLVARRELYKARFQRYLDTGKLEEATKLLEQFRSLEGRSDLMREVEQREQRVGEVDRTSRAKIDQLLKDTRQLLTKFLDPGDATVMIQALDRAKRGG